MCIKPFKISYLHWNITNQLVSLEYKIPKLKGINRDKEGKKKSLNKSRKVKVPKHYLILFNEKTR